jgi:hypothetical protein
MGKRPCQDVDIVLTKGKAHLPILPQKNGYDIVAPLQQAEVAQLVEQCFRKAEVAGSIPAFGSMKKDPKWDLFCWL